MLDPQRWGFGQGQGEKLPKSKNLIMRYHDISWCSLWKLPKLEGIPHFQTPDLGPWPKNEKLPLDAPVPLIFTTHMKAQKQKLRWYPQQPQRFYFYKSFWACCEAKRWKHLAWVLAANPVEADLALHQSLPDLLRNLLRNHVEPDLALQSLPEPSPEPSLGPCWT